MAIKPISNPSSNIPLNPMYVDEPSVRDLDESFTQAAEWKEEVVIGPQVRKEEKKKGSLELALSILKLSQKMIVDKNVKKLLKVPASLGKLALLIQSYGSEKEKTKSVKEKDWRAYMKEGMEVKKAIVTISKVLQAGSELLGFGQVISITKKISSASFYLDMTNIILQPTFSLNPSQLFGTEKERSALLKNFIAITALTVSAVKSDTASESLSKKTVENIVDNTSELLRFQCGVVSIFGLNAVVDTMNILRNEGIRSLTLTHLVDCSHAIFDVVMFVVDTKKQITFVAIGVIALGIGTYHIWNAYQQSKPVEIPLVEIKQAVEVPKEGSVKPLA